jgi:hypothetical protein
MSNAPLFFMADEVTDGDTIFVPVCSCNIYTNMEVARRALCSEMDRLREETHALHNTHECVISGDLPPGVPVEMILDKLRSAHGKQHGERMEQLVLQQQAECIIWSHDRTYFVKNLRTATLQQLLDSTKPVRKI